MKIAKVDAARRQLNVAIEMFFNEDDLVAVHTVIAAAFTIIRNLCEHRGNVPSYQHFTDWIRPGQEGKFWSVVNRQANFLKHAEKDPDGLLDFDPEETELAIVMAAKWFVDLGSPTSPEIRTFGLWFSLMYPEVLNDKSRRALAEAGGGEIYREITAAFNEIDPADRVRVGKMLLQQSRQHEQSRSRC